MIPVYWLIAYFEQSFVLKSNKLILSVAIFYNVQSRISFTYLKYFKIMVLCIYFKRIKTESGMTVTKTKKNSDPFSKDNLPDYT